MSQWIKQTSMVKEIAYNLLSPQKTSYTEEFITFKLTQLPHLSRKELHVQNRFNEKLDAILIYNNGSHQSDNGSHFQQNTCQTVRGQPIISKEKICIIFLHGYGSNKLEAMTLLSYLPSDIDLCCFDFSSSGKSQGQRNTFGLKEQFDIEPKYLECIIQRLKNEKVEESSLSTEMNNDAEKIEKESKRKYGKFVLWGRSMGAVASLLYSSRNICDTNFSTEQSRHKLTKNHDLTAQKRSSIKPKSPIKLKLNRVESSFNSNNQFSTDPQASPQSENSQLSTLSPESDFLLQILDSPFNSFEEICMHQAEEHIKLPTVFISYGMQILKDHFQEHSNVKQQTENRNMKTAGNEDKNTGLQVSNKSLMNPFEINLSKNSSPNCHTPTIFVYNEKDRTIPCINSQKIMQNLPKTTQYEKILIHEDHNKLRKGQTLKQVFMKIKKYQSKWQYQKNSQHYQNNGLNGLNSHQCSDMKGSGDFKIKRGLSVLPSFTKSLNKAPQLQYDDLSMNKFHPQYPTQSLQNSRWLQISPQKSSNFMNQTAKILKFGNLDQKIQKKTNQNFQQQQNNETQSSTPKKTRVISSEIHNQKKNIVSSSLSPHRPVLQSLSPKIQNKDLIGCQTKAKMATTATKIKSKKLLYCSLSKKSKVDHTINFHQDLEITDDNIGTLRQSGINKRPREGESVDNKFLFLKIQESGRHDLQQKNTYQGHFHS